jgi:hypothetical protein
MAGHCWRVYWDENGLTCFHSFPRKEDAERYADWLRADPLQSYEDVCVKRHEYPKRTP